MLRALEQEMSLQGTPILFSGMAELNKRFARPHPFSTGDESERIQIPRGFKYIKFDVDSLWVLM
jgi:hypothetical protein